MKTDTGYITVSSPALTALHLVAYQRRVGGLSRVATVLDELSEGIDGVDLAREASKYPTRVPVQHLGYLLNRTCGQNTLVARLRSWLAEQSVVPVVPLDPGLPVRGASHDPTRGPSEKGARPRLSACIAQAGASTILGEISSFSSGLSARSPRRRRAMPPSRVAPKPAAKADAVTFRAETAKDRPKASAPTQRVAEAPRDFRVNACLRLPVAGATQTGAARTGRRDSDDARPSPGLGRKSGRRFTADQAPRIEESVSQLAHAQPVTRFRVFRLRAAVSSGGRNDHGKNYGVRGGFANRHRPQCAGLPGGEWSRAGNRSALTEAVPGGGASIQRLRIMARQPQTPNKRVGNTAATIGGRKPCFPKSTDNCATT